MSARAPCLAAPTLLAFVEGGLSGKTLSDAEAHFDACPDCQETLRLFGVLSQVGRSTVAQDNATSVVPARYTLVEQLGRGAQGVVWCAHDERLGREVALKVVPFANARARAQFVREGRAIAALNHPNILQIFDVHTLGDHGVLSMSRCDRSLQSEVIAWDRARRALAQVAAGLVAVHEVGLVHRDIKPSNLFIAPDGRIMIGDFGLVSAAALMTTASRNASNANASNASDADADKSSDRALVGTPAYMAPELLDGAPHSPATDQYSFFASAFTIATGALPTPPLHWDSERVPLRFRPWFERGLAQDPSQRFPSMQAALGALVRRPRRRGRVVAAVAGGGVAMAAVGAWLAVAPGHVSRACETTPVFLWSQADRKALRHGVAPGDDAGLAAAAEALDVALAHYAAGTAELSRSLCRGETRVEQNVGHACLARQTERVDALVRRLSAGQLPEHAAGWAVTFAPEILSYEHCGRTRGDEGSPRADRAAVAAAANAAWAEDEFGDVARAGEMYQALLGGESLVAFPDLHARTLRRWVLYQSNSEAAPSDLSEMHADLDAAAQLAAVGENPIVAAEVWLQRARLSVQEMNFAQAEHDLAFARVALARAGDPLPESIQLMLTAANRHFYAEEFEPAAQLAGEAADAARRLGSDRLFALAMEYKGKALTLVGRQDEAITALRAARAATVEASNDPLAIAAVDRTLGAALLAAARYEEAAAVHEGVLAKCKPGTVFCAATARELARAYQGLERHDDAEALLRRARAVFLRLDHPLQVVATDQQLGLGFAGQGRQVEAETLLAQTVIDAEMELGVDHVLVNRLRLSLRWVREHAPAADPAR